MDIFFFQIKKKYETINKSKNYSFFWFGNFSANFKCGIKVNQVLNLFSTIKYMIL